MKNIEHIKYTYKHRLIVLKLAEKYFEDNKELLERVKYHDIDKLFLYLFYDKKSVSRLHRDLTSHHENDIEKTKLDYMEMILDWESARYTKPDKPLNAYDTLVRFYPSMTDEILPILKEMKIDKPNLPMEEDILELANQIDEITEEELLNELIEYLKMISSHEEKKLIL